MNYKTIVFSLAALFVISSCATVINGRKQNIGFSSNPSGATITVGGKVGGETPVILNLKRRSSHTVTIELSGYQPYSTTITRRLSGVVFGNILIGGVIGVAIDLMSGGIYKLSPEQIQANLSTIQNVGSNDDVFLFVVLKPEPGWEKFDSLTRLQ